jgi:diaminopimelate decarboxylase
MSSEKPKKPTSTTKGSAAEIEAGCYKVAVASISESSLYPIQIMRGLSNAVIAISILSSACTAFAPASLKGRSSIGMAMANPEKSNFLTAETASACIEIAGGSPLYAYSLEKLGEAADACLAFPSAYGLTVRYAMKSCPNSAILKFFNSKNVHIDASSGYEVRRAISAGIPAENISLSTQELPSDFVELVNLGIKVNAW